MYEIQRVNAHYVVRDLQPVVFFLETTSYGLRSSTHIFFEFYFKFAENRT
jgi:hypothetical protein